MRRVLRAPLVHFLVIGAVLLALRSSREGGDAGEPRPRIVFTATDVAQLREGWAAEHGTSPGAAAEVALVRDAIDEEVLYREALAAGMDRRDGAVQERLARLGGFLGEDGRGDRDRLASEARRLGLERSDVVIRRHLVEMMQLAAARPGPGDLPGEADLEAYFAAHAAELAGPAEHRLTHVYLSAARHGAGLDQEAAVLLEDLRRTGVGPEGASARGEAFIRGAHVGPASRAELARIFGDTFAAAVQTAPARTWVGPLSSSYGLHLVWVEEHLPPRVPPLAAVRSRIVLALLRERGARHADERLQALRARYEVTVETP